MADETTSEINSTSVKTLSSLTVSPEQRLKDFVIPAQINMNESEQLRIKVESEQCQLVSQCNRTKSQ